MKALNQWYLVGAVFCALATTAVADGDLDNNSNNFNTNLPVVRIVASDPTALQGTSAGAFTVVRNGFTNAALAVYFNIGGTASNGVDYAAISSPVTIPAGLFAVDIPIIATNVLNRGNVSVTLSLQTNANYQLCDRSRAKVEIVDDIFNISPPTISITSPTNGSVFGFPTNITVTASASDTESPVSRVSFYAGDRFLGSTTNAPYSIVWSNVPPGKFSLFARAQDEAGQSTFSQSVQISVTNSSPQSPNMQ
jgi:hypothetical protein